MERQDVLRQMITDYRKKIEIYEGMIREWELELGISPGAPSSEPVSQVAKPSADANVAARIREWQFYGKSQPEAAKALLEFVGHPLRTDQIMECIEKGGVKIGGKNEKDKKQNLYTILHRSAEVVRIERDTWGLPGWPGAQSKDKKDDNSKKDEDAGKEG